MTHASAVRTLLSFLLLPPLVLTGCGGGMTSQSTIQPTVTDLKKKPPKPKPVTLPAAYTMIILSCPQACQAEAVNDSGTVVGWQVIDQQAFATAWNGTNMQTLGAGYALAINNTGTWVGYTGFPPVATVNGNAIGTLAGYDSSESTAIDDDGTVVGIALQLANPSVQTGFRWTATGGMVAIPELSEALAIHHGVVGGIGLSSNAIAGQDLGLQGAVTALSDAGAAGFTFGSVTQGFTWQAGTVTLLGTAGSGMSLASGISPTGIVVGQVGSDVVGSMRLNRNRAATARVTPRFVGVTKAMAWTPTDGMVDLNTRIAAGPWSLAFATGTNTGGAIVGAAVNSDTLQTQAFVLEAQ